MIYDAENNVIDWNEVSTIEEISRLKEINQNQLYHKEGNAFNHTKMVTEEMIKLINNQPIDRFLDPDYRTILVLAALLHDVGKYTTSQLGPDGLWHNPNHAIEGEKIAKDILEKYNLCNKMWYQAILSLVRYHMQPLYIGESGNRLLKIVNKLKGISFVELVWLKRCDCRGAIMEYDDGCEQKLNNVLDLYYNVCSYPAGTLVTIKKIKDLKFSGYHPVGIDEGYTNSGKLFAPVTIDWRTYVGRNFSTSPVKKIIDRNHFETENSIYEIYQI